MDNQTYVLLSEIRDLMRESVELQKATLEEIRGANPQYPIHEGTLEDLFSQMYDVHVTPVENSNREE